MFEACTHTWHRLLLTTTYAAGLRVSEVVALKVSDLDADRMTVRVHDRVKVMALDAEEFIRRFLLHVVPDGFVRIRHFGLLANRTRRAKLARCRELLAPPPASAAPAAPLRESVQALMLRLTGLDIARCAVCQQGQLRRTDLLAPRPDPPRPVPIIDTS